MAVLIPVDGAPQLLHPANGRSFTLPELQTAVGGYIELIAMGGGLVAFCNEDGKRLELPVNSFATHLLRHRLQHHDYIVGQVVVCTMTEAGEGEDPIDG